MPASDINGADLQSQAHAVAAVLNARRASQKAANGHGEGADSPVSRTATPNLYNHHVAGFAPMDDGHYQGQTLGFGIAGTSPGRAASPLNGDAPQTQEQLIAAVSSLKTRVSELEVINDFMQRQLAVPGYNTAQEGQDNANQVEAQLRAQVDQLTSQLEESHRRENMLKRRLDELEAEMQAKAALEIHENDRAAKRPRLDSEDRAEGDGPAAGAAAVKEA